ncbi:MAG: translocation protein TolB, partial [Fulvivirga sp.]|nr:translocation protein TolB [Fulvivirga sp.]
NSYSDLQQSNVGIKSQGLSPGGETQFIKPYIEVAHPGSMKALKEELLLKVSTLMVNEMMFGGSLKDMFQSSVLLNLPEWFISGAALYVAKGWSIEMDDFIRDYITTRKPEKLNRLSGREAALAGQSVWNYIAQQYGRSNISNILNYTRIIRNEEKSISITLGVPFRQVLYNWRAYYIDLDTRVDNNYITLDDDKKLVKNKSNVVFQHVAFNPNHTKLAYTENNRGKYKVIIRDIASGKENVAIKGGYKLINQEINTNLPLVDWVDSATVGIIHTKKGKLWFELYDLNTNSSLPRQLRRFEQVQSMNFSDNGRLLIISAIVKGQNDLFLLSTRRDRVKRLTTDIFDDIDPSFVPNSNTIVFSSNRKNDTLNVASEINFEEVDDNFNLFFYNLDTTSNVLHRVTNTISKDVRPLAKNGNLIYYLSSQRGITNIFKFDIENNLYKQVTNYASSIEDYDIGFGDNYLALSMNEMGHDHIFLLKDFDTEQEIFTPGTPRKQYLQAREFKERRAKKVDNNVTIQQIVESRLKEKEQLDKEPQAIKGEDQVEGRELPRDTIPERASPKADTLIVSDSLGLVSQDIAFLEDTTSTTSVKDTTKQVEPDQKEEAEEEEEIIDTDNYVIEGEVVEEEKTQPEKEKVINTDDYTFETDIIEQEQNRTNSFLNQYRKLRQRSEISGPYPYSPRFSARNLVTSFVIDPLRGFGVFLETEMYDMLENHKFEGGVMATTDLRNGDIFAEYSYLKTRLDYSARFERSVILRETGTRLPKYSKNTLQLGVAYPFNNKLRLAVEPFVTLAQYIDLNPVRGTSPPRFAEAVTQEYLGANTELVYDNSIVNGMNIIEGTRAKIQFTHYEGISDKDLSFSNFSVDIRHYQEIHREIVLAGRLFYGSFFGRNPKQYLLGGMDNWLFKKENQEGQNNPLNTDSERIDMDLLFVEYATNLRGFDYATLFGRNVLLFNAELRIPIIRYLASGPITSNFFRNLQFTGFFDIGSSWTGKTPFNEDNTISIREINQGGFEIDIKNFQNPWLYSYGAGLRTMLLGYYVKFDLAWPVEDFRTQDPRLFVTLGYDF